MIMIRRDFIKCVVAACLAPFVKKVSANKIDSVPWVGCCPVCGEEDVDINDGVMICNNQLCGAEASFEVSCQMSYYPSLHYTKKPKLSWNARKKLNKKRKMAY